MHAEERKWQRRRERKNAELDLKNFRSFQDKLRACGSEISPLLSQNVKVYKNQSVTGDNEERGYMFPANSNSVNLEALTKKNQKQTKTYSKQRVRKICCFVEDGVRCKASAKWSGQRCKKHRLNPPKCIVKGCNTNAYRNKRCYKHQI